MKGKRYAKEDKIRILKEVGAGKSIVDTCHENDISDVTYHQWRSQFAYLEVHEAERLNELVRENTALKKMLADAMLARKVLAYALERKF